MIVLPIWQPCRRAGLLHSSTSVGAVAFNFSDTKLQEKRGNDLLSPRITTDTDGD